jgi:hypothetical protein
MEGLCYDTQPLWGPLSWIHLYTAAGFVASMMLIVWQVRHRRTTRPRGVEPAQLCARCLVATGGGGVVVGLGKWR